MVVGCVGTGYVLRVELPVQKRLCPIFVRDVRSPDIHECFRGLMGSQRTPGIWGVTSCTSLGSVHLTIFCLGQKQSQTPKHTTKPKDINLETKINPQHNLRLPENSPKYSNIRSKILGLISMAPHGPKETYAIKWLLG